MNIRVAGITEEELKIKMERNEEAAAPTPSVLQAVPGTAVMDPPSVADGKKPHDEVNLDNPAPSTEALLDDSDKDDQKSDKGDEDKPEEDSDDEADKRVGGAVFIG